MPGLSYSSMVEERLVGFVVARMLRDERCWEYLRLEGPFEYPRWVIDPGQARFFQTYSRAQHHLAAHGGSTIMPADTIPVAR